MTSLPPVVGEQYVAPEDTQLSVTRKMAKISDGNFAIANSEGKPLFKLTNAVVSLREKRTLYNHADTPVLTLHKKAISLHDTWQAYAGEGGDLLFSVGKSHIMGGGGVESFDVTVAGASEPDYLVKGDFVHRSYSIVYRGDVVAAEVHKKLWNLSSMIFGNAKNKYGVRVNGGVDQALIAAVVLIMDAVHQEDKDSKGEGSSSDSE